MNFLSTKQVAKLWGVSERRVRKLAKDGKIDRCQILNRHWVFPPDVKKPDTLERIHTLGYMRYGKAKITDGKFDEYGDMYVPESYRQYFEPIQKAFVDMVSTSAFERVMSKYLTDTPLFIPENFNKTLGGVKLIIKREDLNTSGTLYANQAYPLALLFKRLMKKKITIASGDASFVRAFAEACRKIRIPLKAYISRKDYLKQKGEYDLIFKEFNLDKLWICEEGGLLFDAVNYAFRHYFYEDRVDEFYFPDAIGPHPYPQIVEFCQSVIGHTTHFQLKRMGIDKVSAVIAPANVGSNALGIFTDIKGEKILVESESNPVIEKGHTAGLAGFVSKTLVTRGYCKCDTNPVCVAMSYPALSPKLAYLLKKGKVRGVQVTDREAMLACKEFFELEGIFPALEDGYSLAYIKKRAKKMKSGTLLIAFTSKGDKDFDFVFKTLREE